MVVQKLTFVPHPRPSSLTLAFDLTVGNVMFILYLGYVAETLILEFALSPGNDDGC